VPGVSPQLLVPARAWEDPRQWERAARSLAAKFRDNFLPYADQAGADVLAAGPQG
jgi:phosphoenolpyruvate carboxykinase (ATP)